jgi:archaellum component FlaC
MHKPLLRAAVMGAFGLGMILAVQQSTPNFRDVPAGHWAKEAVEFIAQCGLIQGFEDGTFRGNQNLTRYQAALIFYRFIQLGGRCPNQPTTPQDQAMIDKAMEEVSKELSDLKAQLAGIAEANTAQDAKLQALEAQVQQLAAAQAQPAPAPTVDTSALEGRIAALEEELKKVAAAQAQPAPAPTTAEQESSQQARLEALESLAKELNGQIKALNDQVNTLKAEVNTLKAAAVQPTPQPQPVPAPQPAPQPAQPEVAPPAPAPAPLPRVYFGLGASYPVEPMVSGPIEQVISVGGFIGIHDVILGFGPRVGADYNLTNGAINVNAYLVRNFNRGGFLDPYLGLGVRYDASSTNPSIVPVYGDAVLGAGFNFSRNFGLYLEGNPGLGDNLSLRFGVRAGLKLSF